MDTKAILKTMYGAPHPDVTPIYVRKIGSREEVWEGKAVQTKGGLKREDLRQKVVKVNPNTGKEYTRLVSVKASDAAKRNFNLNRNILDPRKNE